MARSDVLVSADWAEQNLNAPKTVFVEVDEDTSAYDGGHIEGAIRLDWRKDLQDGVRRDFLNQEQFSDLLSAKGVANDDTVVLYGGNNNWFAAYAYWYFKLYGHQDIKLIDGGRKKWELDGRPLSKDDVTRPATAVQGRGARHLDPRVPRRGHRRHRHQEPRRRALAPTSSPARSSPRPTCRRSRRSSVATSPAPSTSRGAPPPTRTAPSSPTTTSRSCTRTKGFDDSKETIAYCRIGERSSHTWFVLQEILGKKNVKNYDGSWVEYGSLVGAPIELGA